jgi:hypothetical protein
MRKLFLILFLLTSFITYSQSGVGYVNYTSYKTHNGNGSTNQYTQFGGNAAEFDAILNTANSNTTITHTGEVTLATMCNGSTGTPHWGGDFYAIKFEFWFIPTETGSYRFGVNSDDASDLSVDGTIIATYYGGHGASGYQYGSKNMVAGTMYKIIARYQEFGGGDALYVRWSRPSAPNTYSYWSEEVTNNPITPTKKAVVNFDFNSFITKSKFGVNVLNYTNSSWTTNSGTSLLPFSTTGQLDITKNLDSTKLSTNTAIALNGATDMTSFTSADIGKVYKMTVTGASGGGWGTDIYTNDSYIPAMAVHAGVLTIGQTKEIYVKVVAGQSNYPGTTRNGIQTSEWGGWDLSYQFVTNPTSYAATITGGQVEWSYCVPNSFSSGYSQLMIDMRQLSGTNPASVTTIKLLDIYNGAVEFISSDATWAQYKVPSSLTKATDGTSTYNQYIRGASGYYAFASTISFSAVTKYKTHATQLAFNNLTQTEINTVYNTQVVTVSDVYLAFKELANGGIFGNQSGNEFVYGIQFMNADVDGNGSFNEADCFKLLQHMTGVKNLVDTVTLDNVVKLIKTQDYNSITKSNWQTKSNATTSIISTDINTTKSIDTFNISVTWKGDVNLSASSTPVISSNATNSLRTFSTKSMSISTDINATIMTEVIGDSVYTYITLDPLQQNVVGTHFQLNYDNSILKFKGIQFTTKGSPTNYATDKGSYINLGSLISDGSTSLDKTTTYKISFSANTKLDNIFGLISIGSTDAVNQSGLSLKIKIN